MDMMVWNLVLSFVSAAALLWVKAMHDEMKRLSILISKTREEHTDKFVSKQDMHNDMSRIIARLDRLDEKLDAFMKEQRSALG
jgi:hypothetical protein